MSSTLTAIITVLQLFFSKNPTVEEIVQFAPPLISAISAAKAGQAFSVSFPESIDGKAGMSSFGWTPN